MQIKHLSRAKKNSEKHYKTLKHKKLATCSFLWLEIICPKDTLKNSVTAHSLGLLHRHFAEIFYSIGHVNEYPTMQYYGSPGHTQSLISFIWFWLSISGNSREKLHCGNAVNMHYLSYNKYTAFITLVMSDSTLYVLAASRLCKALHL